MRAPSSTTAFSVRMRELSESFPTLLRRDQGEDGGEAGGQGERRREENEEMAVGEAAGGAGVVVADGGAGGDGGSVNRKLGFGAPPEGHTTEPVDITRTSGSDSCEAWLIRNGWLRVAHEL